MKLNHIIYLAISTAILSIACNDADKQWLTEKHKRYSLSYTSKEKANIKDYVVLIDNGIKHIEVFFNSNYKQSFEIFIHHDRHSIDSTWQKDWNIPGFKSECWMVASGVANKLDMISPKRWEKEACEHLYSETVKTQQLVTHELVHVYHGQLNISPDFSNVEGIDWFVEGLATYISGQCDSFRISDVQNAISNDNMPANLDDFWSGKNKYGLSGSIVMFIDRRYGRAKLIEILPLNRKTDILSTLRTTESELLKEWQRFIQLL